MYLLPVSLCVCVYVYRMACVSGVPGCAQMTVNAHGIKAHCTDGRD